MRARCSGPRSGPIMTVADRPPSPRVTNRGRRDGGSTRYFMASLRWEPRGPHSTPLPWSAPGRRHRCRTVAQAAPVFHPSFGSGEPPRDQGNIMTQFLRLWLCSPTEQPTLFCDSCAGLSIWSKAVRAFPFLLPALILRRRPSAFALTSERADASVPANSFF